MSTIIASLLPSVLVLLYINVGLVNGQDDLPALMGQICQEYVGGIAPCIIIRNAYDNYKAEMMNFRKIQQNCRSTPPIVGFNEACGFLTEPPPTDEKKSKRKFIRRVYYTVKSAVGNTPFHELTPMHVVNGLVTNSKSDDINKVEPAKAICHHWATVADLCRGDNDKYKFGSYEVYANCYTQEKMNKVLAACQALGLRSTLRP